MTKQTTVEIPLINREGVCAIIDRHVYDALLEDKNLKELNLLERLRIHSNGYAFFQRYVPKQPKQTYENIYLHKLVAKRFIEKPSSDRKLFVRFIDGNKLNATLANLEWVTMPELRRHQKGGSPITGYRGVALDRGRFRAVLYYEDKMCDLGLFKTAQEAGLAYNKKSRELFGETNSLNVVLDKDGNVME